MNLLVKDKNKSGCHSASVGMLIHFKRKSTWAKRRQSYLKRYFIFSAFTLAGTGLTVVQIDPFYNQRQQMVEQQIIARGVSDRQVIESMRTVPRHLFVSKNLSKLAYKDFPLSIDFDQTISQPYIVAFMSEAAHLTPESRILEIGTGSGYQAAVLSQIGQEVFSIEIIKPLAENARRILKKLGYANVHVRCGDGTLGWPEEAPFDAIIVTAASEQVPSPLLVQLKNGGRLIAPVGNPLNQQIKRYTKNEGGTSEEILLPVLFVPLVRSQL